jgi:hypothetical protein
MAQLLRERTMRSRSCGGRTRGHLGEECSRPRKVKLIQQTRRGTTRRRAPVGVPDSSEEVELFPLFQRPRRQVSRGWRADGAIPPDRPVEWKENMAEIKVSGRIHSMVVCDLRYRKSVEGGNSHGRSGLGHLLVIHI